MLTDTSEGTPHSEKSARLLRKVSNDWKICGIAYGTTPDRILDADRFESAPEHGVTAGIHWWHACYATRAVVIPPVSPAESHRWSSDSGSLDIEAKIVDFQDGVVTLNATVGDWYMSNFDFLSKRNKAFVQQWIARFRKRFQTVDRSHHRD